ncbi:MAG: hypothetical protein CMN76_06650 [Spirochaetaceae bacterium]|nr:hypothetical protein [Spirochaetaceae bacterium]
MDFQSLCVRSVLRNRNSRLLRRDFCKSSLALAGATPGHHQEIDQKIDQKIDRVPLINARKL